VVLAASCFAPILFAYPYFFPFFNSLAFGYPAYSLLNDSNVSWNEGLPEVERFARQQQLTEIRLDWASLSDPALVVPGAQIWDCQAPADRDAGQWVAVTAVSILENRMRRHSGIRIAHSRAARSVFKLPTPTHSQARPVAAGERERKTMWDRPSIFAPGGSTRASPRTCRDAGPDAHSGAVSGKNLDSLRVNCIL
jgi:hypothetical protein